MKRALARKIAERRSKDFCAVTIAPAKRSRRTRLRISLQSREFGGLLWQILVVGITVAAVAWLWSNAIHNLSARRISTGFGFLSREAGMPIVDTWLAYSPKDTYLRAFIVGVSNTLRVAVIGIVLATVLGTSIGIARLSANWLLSRLAAVYVEVLRDIPLPLQLLFWYVLMQGLPGARRLESARRRVSVQSRPDAAMDTDRRAAALGARRGGVGCRRCRSRRA
jgi:general L-amino acid transport system permease protein